MGDLAPSLMVKFKVGTAAQTVVDLLSQSKTMSLANYVDIAAAGADVMAPFSATPLIMRVTNVASDGKGRAFVYWSCGQGILPPYAARSTVSQTPTGTAIPNNLLYLTSNGTNTSFLMAEVQYTYSAPARFVLPSPQSMSVVAYSLPRVSTYIGVTDGSPTYVPPLPTLANNSITQSSGAITCNGSY